MILESFLSSSFVNKVLSFSIMYTLPTAKHMFEIPWLYNITVGVRFKGLISNICLYFVDKYVDNFHVNLPAPIK